MSYYRTVLVIKDGEMSEDILRRLGPLHMIDETHYRVQWDDGTWVLDRVSAVVIFSDELAAEISCEIS